MFDRRMPPGARRWPSAARTGLARLVLLDRWVDDQVESFARGHRRTDRLFYGLSAVGDHGLIWLILAAALGFRSEKAQWPALRVAAAIGIESVLINGPVKWIFRRQRPPPITRAPHMMRRPRTSSFPSGHSTSAFCTAALLSDADPRLRPMYYTLAVLVAWSRVHVRAHYASDVIGGAAIGAILGQIVKRVVPLPRRVTDSRRAESAMAGRG